MTTYSNTFSTSLTTASGVEFTDSGTISLNVIINADNSIGGQGTITTTSTETVPEPGSPWFTTQTITSVLTVSGGIDNTPIQVAAFSPTADGGFDGAFNSTETAITGDISFNDGIDIPLTLYVAGSVPLPPIISFSSGSLEIGPGTATFTLSRGPVPIGDTGSTVEISTVNGTAIAGKDFAAINDYILR